MIEPTTLRQRFLADPMTLRNERRDFPEWRRGRQRYVLWALDVDTSSVRSRVVAARQALDGLLLDGYRRQPHVTLALCGFPAATCATAHDEFDHRLIAAQVTALRTQGLAAFEVDIGGLESFSSAPFLTVSGGRDAFTLIRRCLHNEGPHPSGPYVPHVTVGLYSDAWPTKKVADRFAQIPPLPSLHLRVTRLSLLSYAAAQVGGALFTLAEYELNTGRMHWHAPLTAGSARSAMQSARVQPTSQ